MKVRQRITVWRNDDSRSAALPTSGKDRDSRLFGLGDGRDPLLFGFDNRFGNLVIGVRCYCGGE